MQEYFTFVSTFVRMFYFMWVHLLYLILWGSIVSLVSLFIHFFLHVSASSHMWLHVYVPKICDIFYEWYISCFLTYKNFIVKPCVFNIYIYSDFMLLCHYHMCSMLLYLHIRSIFEAISVWACQFSSFMLLCFVLILFCFNNVMMCL